MENEEKTKRKIKNKNRQKNKLKISIKTKDNKNEVKRCKGQGKCKIDQGIEEKQQVRKSKNIYSKK